MSETDHAHIFLGECDAFATRRGMHRVDRERDILLDREPRHQRIALKHHAALGTRPGDGFALEQDLALVWHLQPGKQRDQRRLSGTRKAEHGQQLAVCDGEVDGFEHFGARLRRAEARAYVFEFEN